MKRDLDLARAILLEVEKIPAPGKPTEIMIEGYPEEDVKAHLRLLLEADLIDGLGIATSASTTVHPSRLTWAGHEFLDQARSPEIWSQVKDVAKSKGLSLSLEVAKAILVQTIKTHLPG